MLLYYRAFDLIKSEPQKLFGVEAVRFIGTEKTFDNGKTYPRNRCYCKNNKCTLPSGVRNITDCVHGPIFISFPHFYLADQIYRRNISGMNPVAGKHQFFITVQKVGRITYLNILRFEIFLMHKSYLYFVTGFGNDNGNIC